MMNGRSTVKKLVHIEYAEDKNVQESRSIFSVMLFKIPVMLCKICKKMKEMR